MAASFANWKPYENYVQSGGEGPGMVDGRYITGAFTGLFAGPPRLATIGGALGVGVAIDAPEAASQLVYPVGLVQNFSLQQNRQWSRIYELGSERSYWISGRTMGQVGLGRVLYDGPSLMRVLFAYYQDLVPPTIVEAIFPNVGAGAMPNPHDVRIPPGFENFYINLASDLFSQPIGLLMIMKNNNEDTYASFYLEACVLPNHGIATDAQGVIYQENVGLQYELLVPIASRSIELIR